MKDNPPETGRETDCTLTIAETGRDTTGTGVHCAKVTVSVIGTDETTEITIAHTRIVCFLLNATTGTGILSIVGSDLLCIQGSTAVTGAPTITVTTTNVLSWIMSGGGTIPPTMRSLTAVGGGIRTVENPG